MTTGAEQGERPARPASAEEAVRTRCRSFCFLQRGPERWTAFLVTYRRGGGPSRGYFTFRSASTDLGEVRTADLFVEETEEEVDQRARGLGRPLLMALLESAVATEERRRGYPPHLQRWFREILGRHTRRDGGGEEGGGAPDPTLGEYRSLYDSYRLDQVVHLITLMNPDHFREVVEILLDGKRIDFRASDRFQLAMGVVQDLERRLALPPFEVWVEDFLASPDAYRAYTVWLHENGGGPED
jgi:hypothetical protein